MSKKYTHTQSLLSAINLLYVAGKDVHVRPSSTILLTDKRFKIVFFNRYRMTVFPIDCGGKSSQTSDVRRRCYSSQITKLTYVGKHFFFKDNCKGTFTLTTYCKPNVINIMIQRL